MANNALSYNNKTIYQIFTRNYSKEGTFKAIENDLERIKDLGIDIIYLMPIHEIGRKNRKGTWGSPYAAKDYYSITPDYGTLDDFKSLINKTHELGMKLIIDMVFNHTAPDSVILNEHPDYYYYKDGKLGNRVGDWSDIIDLETTKPEVQEYLVDVLEYWHNQGVDGFRFDVASIIPLSLFKLARQRLGDEVFFIAESVEPGFIEYNRSQGFESIDDVDLYPTFDSSYCYNNFQLINDFMEGRTNTIKPYVESLNKVEATFPSNYNKCTALENHDQGRMAGKIHDEMVLKNMVAFSILNKGIAFIFAGEEYHASHKPELFEKDPIDKTLTNKEYYDFIKKLISIKKGKAFHDYKNISWKALSDNVIEMSFDKYIGIFNLSGKPQTILLQEGKYKDLISDETIKVVNHMLQVNEPLMLEIKSQTVKD